MWSFGNGYSKNVVVFGIDNSLSSHVDNQRNNFLVLGDGPLDGINNSTSGAEETLLLI